MVIFPTSICWILIWIDLIFLTSTKKKQSEINCVHVPEGNENMTTFDIQILVQIVVMFVLSMSTVPHSYNMCTVFSI